MIAGSYDFITVGQWTFNVSHISSIRSLENNAKGQARVSLISGEVIYLTEDEFRMLERAINRQQGQKRALAG